MCVSEKDKDRERERQRQREREKMEGKREMWIYSFFSLNAC